MFKSISFLFILIFSLTIRSIAQNSASELPDFKFGKVSNADFETKSFGQDSTAAAVRIFDVGNGTFNYSPAAGGFVYILNRHVRYKIISKKAYDLANLEIQLYKNETGGLVKLDFINGAAYNLAGTKVEVSKLKSSTGISSQPDKNHIVKKFTLSDVKEGSVIEFNYQTSSEFIFSIDNWYFQDGYPCKYSSLSFTMPEFYSYKLAVGGYIKINTLKPQEIAQNYFITAANAQNSGKVINSRSMKNVYYAENIPALKNENYSTSAEDYVSKIGFELAVNTFQVATSNDYSSTWEKIVLGLMADPNFGGFLKKNNYDKSVLSGIIKNETDPEIKMGLIFNYVKNNVKWDGTYSDHATAANQRALLEKKSGNSADINLLLLSMLNNAEIRSNPVLISTRQNGAHPGYPLISKFNNVIVYTEIGDKRHLLDATDKNNVGDLIGYQNLNHTGLKIDLESKEVTWISTENTSLTRTNITYDVKLGTDNKLSGTLYISSDNYDGLGKRIAYQTATNEEEFLNSYKITRPGLEIKNYKIDNIDHPELALDESMDISIKDNVKEAGNLAYLMPLIFERTKENPFSDNDRKSPVDFAHPFEENYRITVELPSTYKVETLPKNEKFNLPNNAGSFTITYAQEDNKVSVKSKISIVKSKFTADEYYNLKELYKNIVAKQAEQVVLKKT